MKARHLRLLRHARRDTRLGAVVGRAGRVGRPRAARRSARPLVERRPRRQRARRALAVARPLRRLAAVTHARECSTSAACLAPPGRADRPRARDRRAPHDDRVRGSRVGRRRPARTRAHAGDLLELGLGPDRRGRCRRPRPARSTSSCRRPGSAPASRTAGSSTPCWSASTSLRATRCSSATPGTATSKDRASVGPRAGLPASAALRPRHHRARRPSRTRRAPRRRSARAARSRSRAVALTSSARTPTRRNDSTASVTAWKRSEWKKSKLCCVPGSSAKTTGWSDACRELAGEASGILDEHERVERPVDDEERRRARRVGTRAETRTSSSPVGP